jgi:glyoxylase-like metal-dependent hydrolase (beta-lactamase superfamily II)
MSFDNVKRLKIKLPFPPFASNAFLFSTSKNRYLFDTGLKDKNNIQKITRHIKDFGGIDAIILSHGHLDHAGCAAAISKKFDVPVYVSFDEKERVSHDFTKRVDRRIKKILKILDYFGFDKETTQREYDKIGYYKDLMDPIEFYFNVRSLNDPDLEIIELPGHTMGCIGVYLKKTSYLFSGDSLLQEGISPFFDVETMKNSLSVYLDSLDKISGLNPNVVFPGHGEPFMNCAETINIHKAYVTDMTGKITRLIHENKPFIDIYKSLFPPRYNILIALSEIIFALENSRIPILQNLADLLSE